SPSAGPGPSEIRLIENDSNAPSSLTSPLVFRANTVFSTAADADASANQSLLPSRLAVSETNPPDPRATKRFAPRVDRSKARICDLRRGHVGRDISPLRGLMTLNRPGCEPSARRAFKRRLAVPRTS